MSLRQEDLISLNQEIFSSMLGLSLNSLDVATHPPHRTQSIGACVQMVGAWRGAVRLDCSLARQFIRGRHRGPAPRKIPPPIERNRILLQRSRDGADAGE